MHDAPASLFVADNWRGGFYELLIYPMEGDSAQIRSILAALWSFPSLEGCYREKDRPVENQQRVQPRDCDPQEHLCGIADLPDKRRVICASYAMAYNGEPGLPAAYWVRFYIPLGALCNLFPVGAYPFAPMTEVPEWRASLDELLRNLAQWTFDRTQFELGIIGFEISAEISVKEIRLNGIPEERPDGILWNREGKLLWFPPNRP